MSIALHTIQFNMFGNPYEISLWIDDEEMDNLEAAFLNWSLRTEDFTDYDFAQYISSKGHFALTQSEYDHREQLRPYFDRLEAGADTETIVRGILQRKGMLNELDNIIDSYYQDSEENPHAPKSKKLAFIRENYWNFGDYLVDYPLLDD